MWSPIYLIFCFVLQVLAIWPQPVSFTKGNSTLWIESSLKVTYNGESCANVRGIPFHDISLSIQTEQVSHEQRTLSSTATRFDSHSLVEAAVSRTLGTLFKQNFVPWKLFPRNSDFEPEECACEKPLIKSLAIIQTGKDNSSTFKPLAGQVDESYNLTLTTSGQATINAASHLGVFHALESFIQLFYQHSKGGVYTSIAPVTITDSPKFQHRGLNMDVSRNWYPVKDILRTIDAISWNKFNRLHLHMTDAQSWPMDIPAIPELSQKGAYQKGLSYSRKDIQEIQTYAIQRGVEVIIEFDMPGHTTSIAFSHPELIAVYDMQPYDGYCNEPPCGTLKLNSSAVYTFLDKLFADVLPRVSPYSSYVHTGGDEVNIQDYLFDETVKSNDTKILQPLIQKLVNHTHSLIRAAGLSPIVWEEMATAGYPSAWNLTLGDDVVVQTWQGGNAIASITASGHKVIAGDYNFWYLDCGKGQWLDFTEGAAYDHFYPFADYCSPSKNWRLIYSYDPLSGIPTEQQHLVLGGEVHIWSEQTDPINLDDMVWPRASAAGEVLWSGRQDANGNNRTQFDASPRLAEMRERMVNRGIRAGPVQMVFCTQSNSTECAFTHA